MSPVAHPCPLSLFFISHGCKPQGCSTTCRGGVLLMAAHRCPKGTWPTKDATPQPWSSHSHSRHPPPQPWGMWPPWAPVTPTPRDSAAPGACHHPGHPPPQPLGMQLPAHPSPTAVGCPGRGAAVPNCCLPVQARPHSTCPRCATAARWWTPRHRPCEGPGEARPWWCCCSCGTWIRPQGEQRPWHSPLGRRRQPGGSAPAPAPATHPTRWVTVHVTHPLHRATLHIPCPQHRAMVYHPLSLH